ncbi:MAG: hypothetical protein AMXMBFR34_07520 [Myxococcaceae bacterium]
MLRLCSLVSTLALLACRYHAANVENLAAECETHCAAVHERCVQQGQAVKWGLPGVTFDLCRREQEACRTDCRPLTPSVVVGSSSQAPGGVRWEPETGRLSCAPSALVVTLDRQDASALHRERPDVVFITLAPDRVALMRAGSTTSLVEDVAMLHGRLTGQGDARLDAQVSAQTQDGQLTWEGEYRVEGFGRFRVHAREHAGCRWLTVERMAGTDAPPNPNPRL